MASAFEMMNRGMMGGGGVSVSGSEGGFAGAVDHAPLLSFLLPHGAGQGIMGAKSEGLFRNIPGLLDSSKPISQNGLFGSGQIWADLKARLQGPATHGAPEGVGTAMSYGDGPPIVSASLGDLGSFRPAGPAAAGGGIELSA
jgi:hypothetical protein